MAENIKEHDRPLTGFKRRYRKAEGIKRLKRGADIPIAVLVSKVSLKKTIGYSRGGDAADSQCGAANRR